MDAFYRHILENSRRLASCGIKEVTGHSPVLTLNSENDVDSFMRGGALVSFGCLIPTDGGFSVVAQYRIDLIFNVCLNAVYLNTAHLHATIASYEDLNEPAHPFCSHCLTLPPSVRFVASCFGV